jgi:hypothetical protein
MGGYSGGTYGTNPVALTANGAAYTAANQTFLLAGSYKTELSFKVTTTNLDPITGETKTSVFSYNTDNYPTNSPVDYELWSIVPTVKITGTVPAKGTNVTTDDGSGNHQTLQCSWNDTEATVYFSCSTNTTCGITTHNYSRPSVTITLTGIGNASKANLVFDSGVHLYNNSTQVNSYEWTSNSGVSRNVGYYKSNSGATDSKTPAGTIKSNTLTMTYNGVVYTFTVPTITLNNPK